MIGFAGLTHLGTVSSIATASKGNQVIAYDPASSHCEELNGGRLPIFEPGLADLLAENRLQIRFTDDASELKACELIFLSLDIPTDQDGHSDPSALRQLIDSVVAHSPPGVNLVLLSQVTPGFTRHLAQELQSLHGQAKVTLYYQAETLIIGRAVERALKPESIVIGSAVTNEMLPEPYASWLSGFECPVLRMSYESAEMTKVSFNTLLASSVCTTNVLAELCGAIGADWAEIVPALRLDRRIGQYAYLGPGLGLSGGNLERDLSTVSGLARQFGTDASVVDTYITDSRRRPDWVVRTLHSQVISRCTSPTIAIWGLAYKPETSSTKNSPAMDLIEVLQPFGLQVYDPKVVLDTNDWPNLVQGQSALDVCAGADGLVIMTAWDEFTSIDLERLGSIMAHRVIIDPFGALDREVCTNWGFTYHTLGAPATLPELGK